MGEKKSRKVNQEGELGGKAFLYASPGITSKEVAMSWDFYKVTKWMNVSLELNLWPLVVNFSFIVKRQDFHFSTVV
jgi:hypothetical protein